MNKRNKPVKVVDLSKIVRSKLVYLNIWTPNLTAPNNYRYFFDSDSELDSSIITGIKLHDTSDFCAATVYNLLPVYADVYINNADINKCCLTLTDFQGNHFWENQVLSSLSVKNTGRNEKRLYSRVKLEHSYITAYSPIVLPAGFNGNTVKYLVPFTFSYIKN